MLVRIPVAALSAAVLFSGLACDTKRSGAETGPAVSITARDELSPESAARVLARVGGRKITLGDYVDALDRMDPLERLRYQTPERRRLLLKELIDTELLAREAERRGLDQRPETQARVEQLMIDDLRRKLRKGLPDQRDVSFEDVKRYYEEHRNEFTQPERRRASVLVVESKARALEILAKAQAAPESWGLLVRGHSVLGPPPGTTDNSTARPPLSLEGDIGLVSAPGEAQGVNPEVPDAVRNALFTLKKQGDLYGQPVAVDGRFFLVRLMSVAPARQRSLQEVDVAIRSKLLEVALQRAEAALTAELRQKYPVKVDQAALEQLRVPAAASTPPTASAPSAAAAAGGGPQ